MSSRYPMRAARALPEAEPITLRWWPSDTNRWFLVGPVVWAYLSQQYCELGCDDENDFCDHAGTFSEKA